MDILYKLFQEHQMMLLSSTTTPLPLPYGPDVQCGRSWKNDTLVTSLRFWVAGVSIMSVDALGIFGNLISLITLSTMTKRGLFIKLLVALTIFDILFLLSGGIFMLQQAFSFQNDVYNALFPKIIYPLAGFSMTASTYTCLAIAVERYIGICRGATQSNSQICVKKARYYIFAILVISAVVDLPRFFELKSVTDKNGADIDGVFEYTELRRDKVYVTAYTLWARLVFTAVLPFVLMVFFNLRILIYYKRNSYMITQIVSPQQYLSYNGSNSRNNSAVTLNSQTLNPTSQSEKSLYVTFFCLTTTFLVCHLPRLIINIYEVPMSSNRQICEEIYQRHYFQPKWVIILSYFEKLALIFNCSINFVFYCFASKMFKKQMMAVVFSRVVRMCQIGSEVIVLADRRTSSGNQGLDHRNSNQYTAAEATTMTASGTMNTTLPSFENLKQERNAAFQATLKSFDENDQLDTIKETVAIIEPPKIEENHIEGHPTSPIMGKVSSQPNLLLTVTMPYGSYFGHEAPIISKSQPNLKVTLSLADLKSSQENSTCQSEKTTSTSDLQNKSRCEESSSDTEEDEDISKDDDNCSTISSCSAGTNSTCSSSFDENCPHCVIFIKSKDDFDSINEIPEVFL